MSAPGKKKVKKELTERIEKLRAELGLDSQQQLAERLGVPRPRVSEWLAGKGKPTPESYLTMGVLTQDPDLRRWFWEQSELPIRDVQLAVAQQLQQPPSLGQLVSVFAQTIPSNARAFTVPENMGGMFAPGDVFIIEPAADPKDPEPLWDNMVVIELPPREGRGSSWLETVWPEGLFVGHLRCKSDQNNALHYYATMGARTEPTPRYSHTREEWPVGDWMHPNPNEQPPGPGSPRDAALLKIGGLENAHTKQREKDRRDREYPSPYVSKELTEINKRLNEARNELIAIETRELREAEQKARLQAPKMVKLYSHADLRIIGGVIAWFPAPKREG